MSDTDKNKKPAAGKAAGTAEKEETVIMSTDAFSKEVLSEFYKRTKAIRNSIGKIDSSFETIAFNLHWINARQAFKAEGYTSITEYADDQFGYQKTTCYNLIAVVDRFAKRDGNGALMESFDDLVKGYSVSKLSLMCNLTDSEIGMLNPSMSVRDIKKFVKGLMGKPLPDLSEGDGEVEAEEEKEDSGSEDSGGGSEGGRIVDSSAKVISNTLIKIVGTDEYSKKSDRVGEYIQRVFNHYPDAVIEISYSLPAEEENET